MWGHQTSALVSLLSVDEDPKISVILPTDPADPLGEPNRARYRTLLVQVTQQAAEDGYEARAIDELLTPAYDLLENLPFWQHIGLGLAVYITRRWQGTFRLPYSITERAMVGSAFLITPVVPLLATDRECFVLALSRSQNRLYRCRRDSMEEVRWPDSVPSHLDAPRHDELGPTNGKPPPLQHYCTLIDRGLHDITILGDAPLILTGESQLLHTYRQITIHPHVVAAANEGDDDSLSEEALQAHARQLADLERHHEHERLLERYHRLSTTGLASTDPAVILSAAYDGRIDTLLVDPDHVRWGTYHPGEGQVSMHQVRMPGDTDLVNLAAVQTLRRGGQVQATVRDRMSGDLPFAAIFRY
jgi:hypothetical protein